MLAQLIAFKLKPSVTKQEGEVSANELVPQLSLHRVGQICPMDDASYGLSIQLLEGGVVGGIAVEDPDTVSELRTGPLDFEEVGNSRRVAHVGGKEWDFFGRATA